MAIDASVGGASSDSYITLANANSYFGARLHTDVWDDADTSTKEKALKWATQILDRLDWVGLKNSTTQALRWPRNYVDDLDGDYFSTSVTPKFLEQATCELAIQLISADRTTDNDAEQLKALTVGPIKLDFNNKYVKEIFPETVKEIVAPFIHDIMGSDFSSVRISKA